MPKRWWPHRPAPERWSRRRAACAGGAAFVLALASLALPSAPGYDPWSWLIWGRELVALDLSTDEGPAWKPLPVVVTAALAVVSEQLAPEAWLVAARAGAIMATLLAFELGRRLAGGSRAAGALAVGAVLLLPGWVETAAVGSSEGLLVALLLMAALAALEGRLRAAFAVGLLASMLRVEAWPFLALAGLAWIARERSALAAVGVGAVGLAALWFVPELLGSGELLRSAERARVPNPGAPALSARPGATTLASAVRLPPPAATIGVVLVAGVVGFRALVRGVGARAPGGAADATSAAPRAAAAGPVLLVAALGAAWVLLVAAMSELGFSGEPRYLLPGAVLLTVAGIAGPFSLLAGVTPPPEAVARAARLATAGAVALALAPTALARSDEMGAGLRRVAHGAALADDLERAVARAGGARALLRCGPPSVGPYRGPMLAWALGVHKRQVEFEPARPGVAFRSRLAPRGPLAPEPVPWGPDRVVRTRLWRVELACAPRGTSGRADRATAGGAASQSERPRRAPRPC